MLLALSSLFVSSLAWRAPNVAVRHSTAQLAAVTMRDNALLIGGASKTRAVGHPQGQSQLPEFLLRNDIMTGMKKSLTAEILKVQTDTCCYNPLEMLPTSLGITDTGKSLHAWGVR